eukprot:5410284-Lingulodinium_polyedra.AAC.1
MQSPWPRQSESSHSVDDGPGPVQKFLNSIPHQGNVRAEFEVERITGWREFQHVGQRILRRRAWLSEFMVE